VGAKVGLKGIGGLALPHFLIAKLPLEKGDARFDPFFLVLL
jgi:hypothetical protein